MPFVLLLVLAIAAGVFVVGLASRYPTSNVASPASVEAAAIAVEESVERHRRLRAFVAARLNPAVATGLALSLALVIAVGGGLVLAVLAYLIRSNAQLRSIDNGAAEWGAEHATAFSTHGLNAVTNLGNLWIVGVLAVAVAVVETIRVPSRWIVPFLVVLLAGNEALMLAIKDLADRGRPTLNPLAATLAVVSERPHLHGGRVFAGAALLLARRRSPTTRSLLAGAAVAIGVGVAASRVLLDVHWLSDVIAGIVLGWGWFAVCSIAFGGRLLRFGAPAETVVEGARSTEAAIAGNGRELSRRDVTSASGV